MKYLAWAVVLASGCVVDEPDLTSNQQTVLSGGAMPRAMMEKYGVLYVGGNGTGVLLDNDLALTAGHVVQGDAFIWIDPEQMHRSMRIYEFGDGTADVQGGTGPDLAVMHINTPMSIYGSRTNFVNTIGDVTPTETVTIMGQGHDQYFSGAGTMRFGEMEVMHASTAEELWLLQSQYGWAAAPGDSGGPVFADEQIVGIITRGQHAPECVGASEQCTSRALPLIDLFWGIVAASEPWNVFSGAAALDILGAEIRANNEEEHDLETGPWSELARIANEMCTNRSGYRAGHLTGMRPGDRYGLACSGAHITTYSISPDDRASNPHVFASFSTVGWAQAARFAQLECERRDAYAGFLTGDVDAAGNWTLACTVGGTLFRTVSRPLITDAGYLVDGVDETSYAQSLRAAQAYCKRRSPYFKTGFMNGFADGKRTYGIFCQT